METMRPQPLYCRIKDFIEEKIEKNEWQTGTKISSESELVARFGVSRMTVNRAVRELTAEGRLIRRQGQGTYVAAPKPRSAFLEINSIAQEIQKSGGRYSCRIHLLSEEKANPVLAALMKLQAYSSIFHSIIVHKDNEVPIQLADRYINPAIAPDYLKQDFSTAPPSDYLLKLAPDYHAEHVVEALIPEAWIRKLLQINEAEPCLALRRTTMVNGKVATKSCFYYPGSRYSLGGHFTPSNVSNG
jgi:GntR family histidine utilization transcriptional repressor